MADSSFSASHYFPNRRRALHACTNCRNRKTRCDAAKPRCSWCTSQNAECVYEDSHQPRIDPNTRILLERMQLLEDRLFSHPVFASSDLADSARVGGYSEPASAPDPEAGSRTAPVIEPVAVAGAGSGLELDVQIPLSHTANANHVFAWPIVQQLLSECIDGEVPHQGADAATTTRQADAVDVFFSPQPAASTPTPLPGSWRLFDDDCPLASQQATSTYRDLIRVYFEEVNVFFSILSPAEIRRTLDLISTGEQNPSHQKQVPVSSAQYCVVLLVLCLASFVSTGHHLARLAQRGGTASQPEDHGTILHVPVNLDGYLWRKAQILLGMMATERSIEAAQCTFLASLYNGARGLIGDSFHWAHVTAVKCEVLVRGYTINSTPPEDAFPDSLRRLYWIAFIWESDFVSEIPVTLPSGLSRFQESVPYPVFQDSRNDGPHDHYSDTGVTLGDPLGQTGELGAFQISTNSALRRFLNRVNDFVYRTKEQHRMTRADYATWLLRITEDLWSHSAALYRNLPDFLLTSLPPKPRDYGSPLEVASPAPGVTRVRELSNNPWNVVRLKGRYYASQYIIHRVFVEYVLLNLDHFETHPCRQVLLERSRLCLEGCRGFIKVFDIEPVNSITCLFASGMVTFTMVMVLMVCTVCTPFREILPADIEEAIYLGTRNLHRFCASVADFKWHLGILDRLEVARKARMQAR